MNKYVNTREEQLIRQAYPHESESTINLKCNEVFISGLPKHLQDFAHKRAVRNIPSINEPSLDFGALVDMVDVEDIAVCKTKLQSKDLQINHLANT